MMRTIIGTVLALSAFMPRVAQAQTEQVFYYHTDAIGSVRMITDETGQVVARYDYLPFGEVCDLLCQNEPAPDQRRQFAGKEHDQETSLAYFGARYYQSSTGRFTTVDPFAEWGRNLGDPQRWNRYSYARNNPITLTDPFGLYDCNGTDKDCEVIDGFVSNLQTSLKRLNRQSDGYKKIEAAIQYLGNRDDGNGVVISPTARMQTPGDQGLTGEIRVDLAQISRYAASVFAGANPTMSVAEITRNYGSAVLVHEARHGLDDMRVGIPMTKEESYRTELNSSWTESYAYEGFVMRSHLWTPQMTPAQRVQAVAAQAQRSTRIWCQNTPGCR